MAEEINYVKMFKCEQCGNTTLEEIMTNVVVASTVSHVCDEGYVDYGEQSNYDGNVHRYQCENCGLSLKGENDSVPMDGESLRDALKFRADKGESQ